MEHIHQLAFIALIIIVLWIGFVIWTWWPFGPDAKLKREARMMIEGTKTNSIGIRIIRHIEVAHILFPFRGIFLATILITICLQVVK